LRKRAALELTSQRPATRMLSGAEITEAAFKHAATMLKQAMSVTP
jgi:DNA repair ATPase RecN